MDEYTLQLLALFGAFWAAILGFAACDPEPRWARRFVAGLALGAVFSHLGWALLHLRVVWTQPWTMLDPALGYTILAFPLGLLATAPWGVQPALRTAYLASAFRNLPLALAVARMGCLVAGCCGGATTTMPRGVYSENEPLPVHPVPIYEIVLLGFLWIALRRVRQPWIAPIFLIGFGGIRLLLEPVRAAPLLGPPLVPPAVLAALWVLGGCGWFLSARRHSVTRPATTPVVKASRSKRLNGAATAAPSVPLQGASS